MEEENKENNKIERAVSKLIVRPLEPGTQIKAEIFEDLLGISRHSQAFSFLISDIRHALYHHGLYLSGEGFSESGAFTISQLEDHYWLMRLALARADRDIEGKLILLINTPTEKFSDLNRKRHDNMIREASMKLDALRHAAEVNEMLKQRKKPKEVTLTE